MKPLSSRRRWAYLLVLGMLFCIVVPLALLYASGWRYKEGFGFVRTGGIYVSVPYDNALVYLDGTLVGESGFLNSRLYLRDLAPSAYTVRVEQEGRHSWQRVLVVEPQLVTDAHALLISEDIETLRLVVGTAATGTLAVSAPERARIEEAFKNPFASSSPQSAERDGIRLVVEEGNVFARWEDNSRIPSIFCGRPSYCLPGIPVEQGHEEAVLAAFYAGGVVYATEEDGVFFSEVDVRPTASEAVLFPRAGATFRILDGTLYIKHNTALYRLDGI